MAGELNTRQVTGIVGITAEIYFGGAKIGANVPLTEIGVTGMYTGDFPTLITTPGVYPIVFVDATLDVIDRGWLNWDGTQETFFDGTGLSIADVEQAIQNQEPIDANITEVTGTAVTDVNDFKADTSNLETKVEADARQTILISEHDQTQTDIANLNDIDITDVETAIQNQEPIDANIVQVTGTPVTDITDFHTDLSALQAALTTEINENETKLDTLIANLQVVDDILDLILKYHDNDVKFFAADGSTETTQPLSFYMTVYDNDGTTVLKRIEFQDSFGNPSVLTAATRYTKT